MGEASPQAAPNRGRTRAEKREQLAALEGAVRSGVTPADAVAAHAARNSIGLHLARRDLKRVRAGWAELAGRERSRFADAAVGLALRRFEAIFTAAMERGDLAAAIEAERARVEVLGRQIPTTI